MLTLKDDEFPWKRKAGICETDGPKEKVEFKIRGINMRVAPTNLRGFDTGRVRFEVLCLVCGELIHEATTGPSWQIRNHLWDVHGIED